MNLKQLEYFVHVAELGSFSKAALVLDVAQPALSRQVRALETDLRETLLLRNGRGVRLTEAGRRLFEHSVGILQMVSRAREDMGASRDEPVGRIVVGLPPEHGTPAHASADRCVSPATAARDWRSSKDCLRTSPNGSLPGASTSASCTTRRPPLRSRSSRSSMRRCAWCSPRRPGAGRSRGGRARCARELPGFPLIVPDRTHAIRRLLETQAMLAGLELDIAWEVASVPSIVDLVCAGYGYAVLSAGAVAASGRSGELAVRPLVEPQLSSVLCLATSAHRRPTPLARHASRLLRELVEALPMPRIAMPVRHS